MMKSKPIIKPGRGTSNIRVLKIFVKKILDQAQHGVLRLCTVSNIF